MKVVIKIKRMQVVARWEGEGLPQRPFQKKEKERKAIIVTEACNAHI